MSILRQRSKLISGVSGWQATAKLKGTAFGTQVGSDYMADSGRRNEVADEALTFFAPLANSDQDAGGAPETATRSSLGLYLPSNGAQWRIAGNNVPRFESAKRLMEPAVTNKCTNYNAQPDAALTNLTKGGDATAVMSRVADADAIEEAGHRDTGNGFAIDLNNNLGGSTDAYIDFGGTFGNTNEHTISGWCRKLAGASDPDIRNSAGTFSQSFSNAKYDRITATGPGGAGDTMRLHCPAGTHARIFFNQVEEEPVVSSPIIISGAANNRASDSLNWGNWSSFFPQAEGMALLRLDIPWSASQFTTPLNLSRLLGATTAANSVMYLQHSAPSFQIVSTDGTSFSVVSYPNTVTGHFDIGVRWKTAAPAEFQTGVKYLGTWTWNSVNPYDGAWPTDGANLFYLGLNKQAPLRLSDLRVYNQDRGTAWIEANY